MLSGLDNLHPATPASTRCWPPEYVCDVSPFELWKKKPLMETIEHDRCGAYRTVIGDRVSHATMCAKLATWRVKECAPFNVKGIPDLEVPDDKSETDIANRLDRLVELAYSMVEKKRKIKGRVVILSSPSLFTRILAAADRFVNSAEPAMSNYAMTVIDEESNINQKVGGIFLADHAGGFTRSYVTDMLYVYIPSKYLSTVESIYQEAVLQSLEVRVLSLIEHVLDSTRQRRGDGVFLTPRDTEADFIKKLGGQDHTGWWVCHRDEYTVVRDQERIWGRWYPLCVHYDKKIPSFWPFCFPGHVRRPGITLHHRMGYAPVMRVRPTGAMVDEFTRSTDVERVWFDTQLQPVPRHGDGEMSIAYPRQNNSFSACNHLMFVNGLPD